MVRDRVVAAFQERFGASPEIVSVAPGRVNLIGEHTDYNGGFVFPAAIDQELWMAAAVAPVTELISLQLGEGTPFSVDELAPGSDLGWAGYPAGVAWAFREAGHTFPNLSGVVGSSVPIGAGVSSSAAIEMAFAVVWNQLLGSPLEPLELAKLGRRCENGFLGVQTGLMDQMASACGQAGHALFFDTLTEEVRAVAIPRDWQIVLADTGVSRALAGSKYNERRAECESVCATLGVPSLRLLERARLEQRRGEVSDVGFRRARHVLTENDRCLAMVEALESANTDRVGELMRASHESLRDDYEVTGDALDRMAEACWNSPGVIGARMTGAGFGGACVALVERDRRDEFVGEASRQFDGGTFTFCEAADGARLVL